MRDAKDIDAKITSAIEHMLQRPCVYGLTPEEIEISFWCYFWFWSVVHNREADWIEEDKQFCRQRNWAPGFGIVQKFQKENPDATCDDKIRFLVSAYREIASGLGMTFGSPE